MSLEDLSLNAKRLRFEKSFTQQEPISEAAIARTVEIMRTGRLHRYNVAEGELSEAALLERDFAAWQGSRFCLACTSGGYALHVALRAAGVKRGDAILANAYTLAPVPGALHNAGGVPVFVEIDADYHIDLADLEAKAEASGARFLMLSHMRGHIADMAAITEICERHGITLIEDCAHTMGARYDGVRSGQFGKIACFSTQTYKHINSGEGGLITTDDEEIAARCIIHSGSYMLFERHGAAPSPEAFEKIKLETPNYSGRLDNLRAALIRDGLAALDRQIERWNRRYRVFLRGAFAPSTASICRAGARESISSAAPSSFESRRSTPLTFQASLLNAPRVASTSNGSGTPSPKPSPAAMTAGAISVICRPCRRRLVCSKRPSIFAFRSPSRRRIAA